jgi:mono/diheme cytochrome c family protein
MADVTPPPNYEPTRQVVSANPAEVDISPLLPPDPAAGKIAYTENCAACHGPTGMGDGERVASLPEAPPLLGSLAYSRNIPPTVWFQKITQGKIEKLMPGFGSSLSDRQRWDIVAYLVSLGTTSEQVHDGETVYSLACQNCHGSNAAGGVGQAPALNKPEQLQQSLDEMITVMTSGKGSMPAVGMNLTENQKLDAAVYLRSLVFPKQANANEPDMQMAQRTPASVPENTSEEGSNQIISGTVINGSGGIIPSGLMVKLTGYDAAKSVISQEKPLDENGGFVFPQVPVTEDRIYFLTMTYKGIFYTSPAMNSGQPDGMQNQQITIYEPNTDVSLVKADRMHIFFEFPGTDAIRIVQLYVLTNPTNTLITSSLAGSPVINYQLPQGASNLQFQGGSLGERFVLTRDGFGDTQGIPPGSGTQVLFSYDLPYKTDLIFSIKVPVSVDSTNIMLPSQGVTLKSRQLQYMGDKTIQNATWHIYSSGSLGVDSQLDLLVSGKPKTSNPQESEMNSNLAVGVIALVIVLLIVGGNLFKEVTYRKNSKQKSDTPVLDENTRNAVLDAIIALDDQYHAGQIPLAAYHERRKELKSRIQGAQV